MPYVYGIRGSSVAFFAWEPLTNTFSKYVLTFLSCHYCNYPIQANESIQISVTLLYIEGNVLSPPRQKRDSCSPYLKKGYVSNTQFIETNYSHILTGIFFFSLNRQIKTSVRRGWLSHKSVKTERTTYCRIWGTRDTICSICKWLSLSDGNNTCFGSGFGVKLRNKGIATLLSLLEDK